MALPVSKELLEERKASILCNPKSGAFQCDKDSVAGSVSQRACVYCGARVVLNPITDAYHIVHGPIGCASYTWDIRGSLSSGPEVYRNSFSTDLQEKDVIFGGETKLMGAIEEITAKFSPKLIFVYATCIVGVIGDDIEAVCKKAAERFGIQVIPVHSSGFSGNKSMGYKAACKALLKLMPDEAPKKEALSVNLLGDFNLAGEMWIIKGYLEKIGLKVVSKITGDGRAEELKKAPSASVNLVQCAGSMTWLAHQMEEKYQIPYVKVSFFGLEDTKLSLLTAAQATGNEQVMAKAEQLIAVEESKIKDELEAYKNRLKGKSAAIYVGGGFKAISLIKQFREMGIKTVMVGTQTGRPEEYDVIRTLADEDTVVLDDANPAELERFLKDKGADILVGGVKERPLAYKLGIAFCDHNHERKHPLCGYVGAVNFAKEIDLTVNSPVWQFV